MVYSNRFPKRNYQVAPAATWNQPSYRQRNRKSSSRPHNRQNCQTIVEKLGSTPRIRRERGFLG